MPIPQELPFRLDFGTRHPTKSSYFPGDNAYRLDVLPLLIGKANHVKSLRMGCKSAHTAAKFVSSIDSLEELAIADQSSHSELLWPAIQKHKQSLQSLAIGAPPENAWCDIQHDLGKSGSVGVTTGPRWTREEGALWSVDQLGLLRTDFPKLEALAVDVPVQEIEALFTTETKDGVPAQPVSVQPSSSPTLFALSAFKSLKSLKVCFIIPDSKNRFINDKKRVEGWDFSVMPGPLVHKPAEHVSKVIFGSFFADPESQVLQELEVCFVTEASYDRAQYYAVKSSLLLKRRDEENGWEKPKMRYVDNGRWVGWSSSGTE